MNRIRCDILVLVKGLADTQRRKLAPENSQESWLQRTWQAIQFINRIGLIQSSGLEVKAVIRFLH
jgi:hypothetical protein